MNAKALSRRARHAAEFLSDAGFASPDTKRAKLATIISALDAHDALRAAAQAVIDSWEGGNLAEAVRGLDDALTLI